MPAIKATPIEEHLPFGVRVYGATKDNLNDTATRQHLNELFEERGLIIFEGIEPSSEMQLVVSDVFGPLKEHPVKMVSRVDADLMPGVIELRNRPESALVEIDGKTLISWLPWHFDHNYNDELNRAGVLRAVTIPPEGGMTGFADGIQIYNDFDAGLRKEIENLSIIYTLDLRFSKLRFGLPKTFRVVKDQDPAIVEAARKFPRAIHPAVWRRSSGEHVMHLAPWAASGIEGREDAEGDQLFEAATQEVLSKMRPYWHEWATDQMIIWDNWRMLHASSGTDPSFPRLLHRTTIKGDYGLGHFENDGVGDPMLEMTV